MQHMKIIYECQSWIGDRLCFIIQKCGQTIGESGGEFTSIKHILLLDFFSKFNINFSLKYYFNM